MKKILIVKIFVIFLVVFIILTNKSNSYYSYENRFEAFRLNRNTVFANSTILYDKTTLTNQDVEVNINFDKVVSIIGENYGMTLSEDGKNLSKTLSENESKSLLIRDEDFNYKTIEYNVDWIDKEPPVISGAEDGITYNSNVHLEFTDNVGIKEIYSDYYTDSFSIYTETEDFYEYNNLQVQPSNKNSITAYVLSNTKQMEKYNYYIDGVLCATTHDKKYTFTGLALNNENHHIVVEALDRYGNVLDIKETYRKTIPITAVNFSYSREIKYIALKGVPATLTKLTATAWVLGHPDSYSDLSLLNDSPGSYVISILMSRHNNYSGRYYIKFEMEYLEDGVTKKSTIIGTVEMPNKYKYAEYTQLPNDFVENGNYYVRCIDEAGNEKELDFEIKK